MNDEERFRLIADALREAGFDAVSEQTGGDVLNVLVRPNEKARRFFAFHTLDVEWKGAAYDDEDDLWQATDPLEEVPVLHDGQPIASDSTDIPVIAEAIASAVFWNQ